MKVNSQKKSLTLIEVLISVALISIVIFSLLQIKSNNLDIVSFITKSEENSSYLYITALSSKISSISKRRENIYLKDLLKINSDDTRRELKDIKIAVKDTPINSINLELFKLVVYQSSYKYNHTNKNFFTFRLEQ